MQRPSLRGSVDSSKRYRSGNRFSLPAWTALFGTTLTAAPDGTILASGKNPQQETFVIEGAVELSKLTGIRLEALPHEQLPRGGPGRDIYGNAIVSDVKAEIGTAGGEWQPVQFKRVLSDDGRTQDERTRKLWIIDASREDKRLARQLVLILAEPAKLKGKPRLRISIRQDSDFVGQSIGHFRLSVTDTRDPSEVVKVRARQRPILEKPAKDRTEEERKQLAEQFRAVAPDLESARERVKELKKQVDRLGIATALIMGEQSGVERPSDFVRLRGGFANKSEKVYGGVACRSRQPAFRSAGEPPGARSVACKQGQSAVGAGCCQPHLGAVFRSRPGGNERGFRFAGQPALCRVPDYAECCR